MLKHASAKNMPLPNTEHNQISTPNELLIPTPTPQLPNLPIDDIDRFIPSASQFSDPKKRPAIDHPYNAQLLLENPNIYDGYHVELKGKILKIQRLEDFPVEKWNEGIVITIDDGSALFPVLYRGSLYRLENGTKANIIGIFVADGGVIQADIVHAIHPETPWYKILPQELLFSGITVILLGLIAVILLIGTKRTVSIIIAIFILFGLSACEIHIENHIKANGKITTSVQIMESTENIDFFRKIPGLDRYLSSYIAQSREEGSLVENWVEEDNEYFYFQQTYQNISSFLDGDDIQEESTSQSWVYLKSYTVGDEICYRYLAQVSPDILYEMPEDTDGRVINEIHKLIDDIDMTYGISLPGRILYSNSHYQTSNYLEWEIALRENNELIAESCFFPPPTFQLDWIWAWIAIAGFGLVDVGLWLLVIQRLLIKRKS
jgi:hypothetical protein